MKNAFRPLTDEELQFVSGGTGIVVTAPRPKLNFPGFDWGSDWGSGWGSGSDSGTDSDGRDDGYDPGLGHGDPALDPEAVKKGADLLKGVLDDLVEKHGSFNVELPDGKIVSVETLLKGLDKISTAVDVGMLAVDALNGDLEVGAVAGFLVGVGVAAALPPTTSAIGVFVASTLAVAITTYAVNSFYDYADQRIADFNVKLAELSAELTAEMAQQIQDAYPDATPEVAFYKWLLDELTPTPPQWDDIEAR